MRGHCTGMKRHWRVDEHIETGQMVSGVGLLVFFFSSRRRHTRLQGDWSSDVCSSDLDSLKTPPSAVCSKQTNTRTKTKRTATTSTTPPSESSESGRRSVHLRVTSEIGRASCRERV